MNSETSTLKRKHRLILLLSILIIALIAPNSLTGAKTDSQVGLRISLFGFQPFNVVTYVPFQVWFQIFNNDSAGHYYRLDVWFERSMYTENGFVFPQMAPAQYMMFTATSTGTFNITAELYQDSNLVETRTESISVEEVGWHTQVDKVPEIEANISSLNDSVSGLANSIQNLTYGIIVLSAIWAVTVALVMWQMRKKPNVKVD